jgi:hypothetical protein
MLGKILSLTLSTALVAAPISQAFAAEYEVIPDNQFNSVATTQGVGIGVDALASLAIWKLSKSNHPDSAKNQARLEDLSRQQSELVLELDSYNRHLINDSVEFRQRLNDMYAAYEANAEIKQLREAAQALDIANNTNGDVEAAQNAVNASTEKLQAKLDSLRTAESAPLETSVEKVWNIGTFKNADSLNSEYEALLALYTKADADGTLDSEIAKLQERSRAGIEKANPKFEKIQAEIVSVSTRSGVLKRFLVGPILKLTSLAFFVDGVSRAVIVFQAHRDPGLSPALDKINAALGK